MSYPPAWVSILLVLNLSLQVWDGLATYYGLSVGVQEGNALLQACMAYWGVGVTLVGAKSVACVLLVFLWKATYLSVSQWGLVLMAVSYVLGSVVPWCLLLFLIGSTT